VAEIKIPIKWNEANFRWDNNPYKWNEVFIVKKVADQILGGGAPVTSYEKLELEEKKVFINLILTIKGNREYSSPHIYTEKQEVNDDIKVTAEDIKMVIGEVLKVEVANPTVYKEKVPNLSVKVKKPKIKFKNV
jgi:hypothetical protein